MWRDMRIGNCVGKLNWNGKVVKKTGFKVLWDFNVQCDKMVEATIEGRKLSSLISRQRRLRS